MREVQPATTRRALNVLGRLVPDQPLDGLEALLEELDQVVRADHDESVLRVLDALEPFTQPRWTTGVRVTGPWPAGLAGKVRALKARLALNTRYARRYEAASRHGR